MWLKRFNSARLIYLLPAVSYRVVRINPSNAIDGIEGVIPSSACQFELELLEPGDFTIYFVWSVVTETSDLSLFCLLFQKCPG